MIIINKRKLCVVFVITAVFWLHAAPGWPAFETDESVRSSRQKNTQGKGFFRNLKDKITTLGKSPGERKRIIRQKDRQRKNAQRQKEIGQRNQQLEHDRALQEKKEKQRTQKIKKQRARYKNR